MTVVLAPNQTPSGVGLVQGDIGPGDTRFGRYLYVVSGCCEAQINWVVMSGMTNWHRCSHCLCTVPGTPLGIAVRLDMTRQNERVDIQEFVYAWTGFKTGELLVHIDWDLTS